MLLAQAQAQAQSLDDANPAIGRLNHAGFRDRQHCTVSLIGQNEALTAKHCVDGLAPGRLHVVLGYDRGTFSEHLRVSAMHIAQDADIARLCLDRSSSAEPLPSVAAGAGADTRRPTGAVALTGYPRSQAHRQQTQRCAITADDGTLARLDCPAEPGMSGAPVILSGNVIGVMSASASEMSIAVLIAALPSGGCDASDHDPERYD